MKLIEAINTLRSAFYKQWLEDQPTPAGGDSGSGDVGVVFNEARGWVVSPELTPPLALHAFNYLLEIGHIEEEVRGNRTTYRLSLKGVLREEEVEN